MYPSAPSANYSPGWIYFVKGMFRVAYPKREIAVLQLLPADVAKPNVDAYAEGSGFDLPPVTPAITANYH